jgi:hypothetical protein
MKERERKKERKKEKKREEKGTQQKPRVPFSFLFLV